MNIESAKTIPVTHRGRFLRWLRRIHGWVGLWGAILGLLFGFSGFFLNHRAVMKIPAAKMEQSQVQLALPEPHPADLLAFTSWVQDALDLHHDPVKRSPRAESENSRTVAFQGRELAQPAKWKVEFQTPSAAINVEYVLGNNFVTVSRQDANLIALLTRMHKGVGMNAGWVLLVDSLAGAMMLLSMTGVLLWTKMRGSRLTAAGLTLGSLGLILLFTLQSL
ncbi:MAG TPA: PepSY-associated TM helix domain-containing protein [Methylophilaceae bacterium]|jgi:hypothetical protein